MSRPALAQKFRGGGHGLLGIGGVMERLAENDDVDAAGRDRRVGQIAEAVFEIRMPFFFDSARPKATILGELSTAMTFSARRASNCESQPSPAPRSATTTRGTSCASSGPISVQVRPGQKLLPRRPATRLKYSRAVVRRFSRTSFSRTNRPWRRGLPQSQQGRVEDLARLLRQLFHQRIIGALALAARLDQADAAQMGEVGRDARLAEVEDFLQLGDGKLLLLQQRENAQAGGIVEGLPERAIGHDFPSRYIHVSRCVNGRITRAVSGPAMPAARRKGPAPPGRNSTARASAPPQSRSAYRRHSCTRRLDPCHSFQKSGWPQLR
jgi:hypothetical protein